jgi:hypothetical protein
LYFAQPSVEVYGSSKGSWRPVCPGAMSSDGPMNTLPATRSGRCAISHSAHWEAIDSDTGTARSVPVASSTASAERPCASHR